MKLSLYLAWIVSLFSLLGSLYFSEVQQFAPCVLCWYQRIAMYPLVLLLPIGIIRKDKKIYQYVLPLSILGFLVAFYHTLIQYSILSEGITPCRFGVSCAEKYVNYFGFVTIPLLSLLAFVTVIGCMVVYRTYESRS